MKYTREILVLFAILDAFLLGRLALSVVSPFFPPESPWWWQARVVLEVVFLLSLAFSAFGLATSRKWGFILSYLQFPLRILFMHTTFGFLLIYACSAVATGPIDLRIPGVISIVLECARLVITILIHRRTTSECAISARTAPDGDVNQDSGSDEQLPSRTGHVGRVSRRLLHRR